MRNTAKSIAIAILSLCACSSYSQSRPLMIGDTLHYMTFKNVLNFQSDSIQFSDFKGKCLIIDFWNTKCSPCISMFPKLDSIQKEFGKNLQIILVNRETKPETELFFRKKKKINKPDLPMITQDKILHATFPIEGYPFSVWIDRNGIIRNISGGYNTTKLHVKDFVEGKSLMLYNTSIKKEYGSSMDNSGKTKLRYRFFSAISHCNRSFNVGSVTGEILDNGKSIRFATNCTSILNLIHRAFEENGKYNFSSTYSQDLLVKDSWRYTYPRDKNHLDQWIDSNAFNYELFIPISKANEKYKIMQEDIKKYFDLDIHIESRKVESIVLKYDSTRYKLHTKGGQAIDDLKGIADGFAPSETLKLYNQNFNVLVNYLNVLFTYQYPVFNQSSYRGSIDISLTKKALLPLNFLLLQKQLNHYGLILTMEKREIPVLVVRDK